TQMIWLSNQQMSEVAAGLLASSSATRYSRVARGAAESVLSVIYQQPSVAAEAVKRSRELWRLLLRSPLRHVPEPAFAVLLAALAGTALPVDDLLTAVAVTEHPPMLWLAGLARDLRVRRAATESRSFPELPGRRVATYGTRNNDAASSIAQAA